MFEGAARAMPVSALRRRPVCLQEGPNVTLLVEQEADMVARNESLVRDRIKEMLEERLAGHSSAIVWPEKPGEIPDRQPLFQIAYLPLEFAGKPKVKQESAVRELFEKYGEKPRVFKNGIAAAVPAADQVEGLRRAVRYILSAERVSQKAQQLNQKVSSASAPIPKRALPRRLL
jgi:hypothetical protein